MARNGDIRRLGDDSAVVRTGDIPTYAELTNGGAKNPGRPRGPSAKTRLVGTYVQLLRATGEDDVRIAETLVRLGLAALTPPPRLGDRRKWARRTLDRYERAAPGPRPTPVIPSPPVDAVLRQRAARFARRALPGWVDAQPYTASIDEFATSSPDHLDQLGRQLRAQVEAVQAAAASGTWAIPRSPLLLSDLERYVANVQAKATALHERAAKARAEGARERVATMTSVRQYAALSADEQTGIERALGLDAPTAAASSDVLSRLPVAFGG
jgi:hypothetical protein